LAPEDENALVVNSDVFKQESDLDIGNEIVLKIGERDSVWTIVGIVRGGGALEGPFAYASFSYWEHITGEIGRANRIHIVTEQHSADFQAQVARKLEEYLDRAGLRVSGTYIAAETRARITLIFNVVIAFLLLMSVLLALVGGLGLMGIMSINVLERTREIGVMRAIGASDRSILQIFVAEGVLIGMMSWLLGCGIAVPLSKLFSQMVGNVLLNASPEYQFSVSGVLIWLGISVFTSALASFLPAWNASRISVCEALMYE
jgi:putative ABC transport system permease protein